MKKRSVKIAGHDTSVSLEDPFWEQLKIIAEEQGKSLNQIITELDEKNPRANLSSIVRIYILNDLLDKLDKQEK